VVSGTEGTVVDGTRAAVGVIAAASVVFSAVETGDAVVDSVPVATGVIREGDAAGDDSTGLIPEVTVRVSVTVVKSARSTDGDGLSSATVPPSAPPEQEIL